jgi:Ser-tRNA(Ala) deacylase AlaX
MTERLYMEDARLARASATVLAASEAGIVLEDTKEGTRWKRK